MCGVLCETVLFFSPCSFDDYAFHYSTMPLGGLNFTSESSWEDIMTPQSESAQPMSPQSESMDYGLGSSGWFLSRNLHTIEFIVV